MKLLKTAALAGLLLAQSVGLMAQDVPSKTSLNWSIDLMSRHLWRGNNSGTAPCIEPTLELQSGKFTFGGWGAYAWDGSYEEVDLYIQYNTPLFKFSVYDFYCPNENYVDSKFMDFDSDKSVHLFDANIKYKGCEKFPVSILASVIPYGECDKDKDGDQRYSTYFELGYSTTIANKKVSWAVGGTPFEGMYADGANIVNMNMTMYDELKITDNFKLPVRGGLTLNPYTEKLFLTFGVTLTK
ncbi:MAG: hypothetical protein ACEPOZ_21610 [Marinifilaceae bacterium]